MKYDYFGQPKMVDPTLTWESIATTNVGIDLGFLNNDLNVNFDWYQRVTNGMLAPGKELPSVLGASAAFENAGQLRTRGWELNIDYHHVFQEADGLAIHANFNLADYKAVITQWDSDNLINTNYSGKEYGEIWGFVTDRYFTPEDFNADGTYKDGIADQTLLELDPKFDFGPGDIKFVDQNKDADR